jgi:hypothetical protein
MTRTLPHYATDETRAPSQPELEHYEFSADPSPCDGCAYAITCRTRHLACRAFIQYLSTGRWKRKAESRLPCRRKYLRSFHH